MRILISLAVISFCSTAPAYGFADEILKQVLKNSGKGAVKEGLRNGRTKSNTFGEVFSPGHECYGWRSKQFSSSLNDAYEKRICENAELNFLQDNPKAAFDSRYRDYKPDKVTCWFDNCPSRREALQACSWWKYQAVKTDYIRGCREERRTNQILGLQEGSVKKRFRY